MPEHLDADLNVDFYYGADYIACILLRHMADRLPLTPAYYEWISQVLDDQDNAPPVPAMWETTGQHVMESGAITVDHLYPWVHRAVRMRAKAVLNLGCTLVHTRKEAKRDPANVEYSIATLTRDLTAYIQAIANADAAEIDDSTSAKARPRRTQQDLVRPARVRPDLVLGQSARHRLQSSVHSSP